jgi:GDP-L-fucose synthase
MIADITDMKNRIVWDDTKPNGQDYRAYDLEKINSIGFNCEFTIRRGLEKTWDWYTKNSN